MLWTQLAKVCEFFALFCAFLVWGRDLSGAVVTYTDNNAVRDALMAGHTANSLARKILIARLVWKVTSVDTVVLESGRRSGHSCIPSLLKGVSVLDSACLHIACAFTRISLFQCIHLVFILCLATSGSKTIKYIHCFGWCGVLDAGEENWLVDFLSAEFSSEPCHGMPRRHLLAGVFRIP